MASYQARLLLMLSQLCTALRFLTILPVTWRAADDPNQFRASMAYFPVIGGFIGLVGSLAAAALLLIFPQQVVVVLILIYLGLISGFLHLDGLSDSADGLLSSRPREDSLNIMRDSRAGAMGVIAVVCVMLLKYGALSAMDSERLCRAVFFMPLAGRSGILLAMACLPYARPEGGLGRLFYSKSSRKAAWLALLVLFILLAALAPSQCLFTLIIILAVNFVFGRWCRGRLGGATGDTLGAVSELTEAATAVAFSVSLSLF